MGTIKMSIEKLPDDIKNLIKEYIYFTPHNSEIVKEALKCWICDEEKANKKYGAMPYWDTSMLEDIKYYICFPNIGKRFILELKSKIKNDLYNNSEAPIRHEVIITPSDLRKKYDIY